MIDMDFDEHLDIARDYLASALDNYKKGRSPVVASDCTKVVGQLVEADADGKEGIDLRSHSKEFNYLSKNHPEMYKKYDEIFDIYNSLGYEGTNGKRAHKAMRLMKEIIIYFEKEWNVEILGDHDE